MSAAVTVAQSETLIPDVRPIALWVVPVADLGGGSPPRPRRVHNGND